MHFNLTRSLALLPALLFLNPVARADERIFTFSYQATTVPKGQLELEQWATYVPAPSQSDPDTIELRTEFEYGLTDSLQLDFYLADLTWTDPGNSNDVDYEDSAVTLKINYIDPIRDGFGIASYHEVKYGDDLFELENKIIFQQNLDRWTLVGNLTLEALWEGEHHSEDNGELVTSLGAAYEVSPRFFAGLEAVDEIELEDWNEAENAGLFAGPTVSYRFPGAGGWWATASFVDQLTSVDEEPDWQARLIVGTSF